MKQDQRLGARRFQGLQHDLVGGSLAVRNALGRLIEGLSPLNLSVEEIGTVELVLAEVLNNIVEHAYADRDDGRIELRCIHRSDGLHFQISDSGQPMPDGQTPIGKQTNPSDAMDDLPEGGFGWFLIRDLAKDVTYRRSGVLNILTLRLAVAKMN